MDKVKDLLNKSVKAEKPIVLYSHSTVSLLIDALMH